MSRFIGPESGDVEQFAGGTAYLRRGAGEPLIFIHGVGMNKHTWQFQFDDFAKSHDVIAYDMLGHGNSELPSANPELHEYAGQLRDIMDSLNIARATIIGHSMGGLIAMRFAIDQPRRCRRIVVMNSVYGRTEAQREPIRIRARSLAEHGPGNTRQQTLDRWFGTDPLNEERQAMRDQIDNWMMAADVTGYSRTYTLLVDADRALQHHLGELSCPALFMTADGDPNSTPEMARIMADLAPGGQCAIITDERHMMPIVAPDKVNPVLHKFLKES